MARGVIEGVQLPDSPWLDFRAARLRRAHTRVRLDIFYRPPGGVNSLETVFKSIEGLRKSVKVVRNLDMVLKMAFFCASSSLNMYTLQFLTLI